MNRYPDVYEQPERLTRSRAYRDRIEGIDPDATISHTLGNCALEQGTCATCYRESYQAVAWWAGTAPARHHGEDIVVYWRRLGGPWLDCWFDVATRMPVELPANLAS